MPVLTRYIVKEIIKGTSIAMLLLVTLINLFTLSDELQKLGEGTYTLAKIFEYIALTTPRVFYELMPSAALLGSLFVVGAMANNREIVAIRSIGLSTAWIIRSILFAGFCMVLFAILIGEFVAPETEKAAQLLRTHATKNEMVLKTQYGMWLREGNQFINVRKIINNESLQDLRFYEIDANHQLKMLRHADAAVLVANGQWRLQNVTTSVLEPRKVVADTVTEEFWDSAINSDLLEVTVVAPDNLSIVDLYKYINFLQDNNQQSNKYELAFWGRVVNPLIVFVMLMVSSPFVIGIGRGSSTGARIMIGIMIGSSFNIFDKLFSQLGMVYSLNPLLVAITPSLVIFAGAILVLRMQRI